MGVQHVGDARIVSAPRRSIDTDHEHLSPQSGLATMVPPRRDGAGVRRAAFVALWLALFGQVLWMVGKALIAHSLGDKALYDGVIVVACGAFAAAGGRLRWLTAALRALVALTFLGSVADRFGLLGPPGATGVSWGDFAHFIGYTRAVNAFLPAAAAPALAVVATLAETALGLALLLGVRPQRAAGGAALLLALFGVAMTLTLGVAAQFAYAVGVLATTAWAMSTVDAAFLSLDGLRTPIAAGDAPSGDTGRHGRNE